jgi:hypothetical protein
LAAEKGRAFAIGCFGPDRNPLSFLFLLRWPEVTLLASRAIVGAPATKDS